MIKSLEEQLHRDEGEVLHEYKDHLGYSTIGIGRLIDKRKGGGITHEEAMYLLRNDIDKRKMQVLSRLPWVVHLSEERQAVLFNMAFQMGIDGLLGFKNTLAMIQDKRYEAAAKGMLHSEWATQTPERAARLAKQMETDTWQ
jgi:lysozyme